jgi:hypothetical protein
VWKLVAHPGLPVIFVELRDEAARKVTFSALDLNTKQFLFSDIAFEEPWWVTLSFVSGNTLLLTTYNDTNNPDKKSVIAYDIYEKKIRWWRNNFAITTVTTDRVAGVDTSLGMKFFTLHLHNGEPCTDDSVLVTEQNFLLNKPLQYYPETAHFETVKSYLEAKLKISAQSVIEYMEANALIFISYYVAEPDLANYLIVMQHEGKVLLHERIGERLKGIGLDTFFLLSGYLIFVKNKCELISYRLV